MKILLLTQWYAPEPMRNLSELTESLHSLGNDVQVLTGFPNWPTGKISQGYRVRLFQRETLAGISVTRVFLFPYHGKSALLRIVNLISFVISASILAPFLLGKPDVIHAIQPPTTCIPAWILSRIWRVPFTYEVQDMWPETLSATGLVKPGIITKMAGLFCKWAYRRCDAIRVISRGFWTNLVRKGIAAEKLHYIPNWADTEFYKPVPRDPAFARRHGLSGRRNIVYAGNLGLAQGLDAVLNAAGQLQASRPDVQVVLAGDGADSERLRTLAKNAGLSSVRFLGRLPYEDMPQLYAQADALLVHLKPDPLFSITIPHKILTYLAAGRPIIGAVDGDAAQIIQEGNCGMTCRPGVAHEIAAAIIALLSLPPDRVEQIGKNSRHLACSLFERSTVILEIEKMLRQAVDNRICSH